MENYGIKACQFKLNAKDNQTIRHKLQISDLLLLEMILHGVQHGTALPLMPSNCENAVASAH